MSDGTRCDGCKEMIRKDGEDFIEVSVQRRPTRQDGSQSYYTNVSEKHFHRRHCLQLWVYHIGWWDEAFADGVSSPEPYEAPVLVGVHDDGGSDGR